MNNSKFTKEFSNLSLEKFHFCKLLYKRQLITELRKYNSSATIPKDADMTYLRQQFIQADPKDARRLFYAKHDKEGLSLLANSLPIQDYQSKQAQEEIPNIGKSSYSIVKLNRKSKHTHRKIKFGILTSL